MMSTDVATIKSMFKTNEDLFQRAIQDIPEDKWLTMAGDDSNHLLWIAGHMVVCRALVPKMLGKEWSAPWEALFARGAKRVGAEQYPSAAEIKQAWTEVSEKLSTALADASPEALGRPPVHAAPSLDGTVAGTVGFLCLHETYHLGQMGYVRKLLGHGPTVG
jgi:uncharacterized damage-inducible protein DinB